MGSVYEALDEHFGRRVALKLIAWAHVASPEAVERFRQEGRLASTIAHPRCVFVFAADEEYGRPYIVMELMPGETLQTLIEQRGPLPVNEAITKMFDVIDGLREAHIQGVIHRDVKPSNCFLDSDGRVKIGDFGLSKSLDVDSQLTRTGAFIGTPLYASPEQINATKSMSAPMCIRSRRRSITCSRPSPHSKGKTRRRRSRRSFPTHRRHFGRIGPSFPLLEAAILRGLERDRDRRWQDLSRFRDALMPFVSDRLRLADQAIRVSAFLVDATLLLVVFWGLVWLGASPSGASKGVDRLGRYMPMLVVVYRVVWIAYFGVQEGLWGASIGKRLTGLRASPDRGRWSSRRADGDAPCDDFLFAHVFRRRCFDDHLRPRLLSRRDLL